MYVCLTKWNLVATWYEVLCWSPAFSALEYFYYLIMGCQGLLPTLCLWEQSNPELHQRASLTAVSTRELQRKDRYRMTASSLKREMVSSSSSWEWEVMLTAALTWGTGMQSGLRNVGTCTYQCLLGKGSLEGAFGKGWVFAIDWEVFVSFLLTGNNWL